MKRIVVAGSILVDKINAISAYPKAGELTKIKSVSLAVGGCVPNVAIDLAILGGNEISACGSVGKDAEGDFAINEMRRRGVNTEFVTAIENEKTSFTEVMSVTGGERTFFTYPGASANFGYDETPLEEMQADMLHLGYFLLLDKVDAGDAFCAGALCGIAEGMSDKELLTFSAAVAATSLSAENASDGIKSRTDTVEFMKTLKTR